MEKFRFIEKVAKAKSLQEKMDLLEESAEIDNESLPSDPQGRLSKIIQRLKKEYKFNKPKHIIDPRMYKKMGPKTKERILYDNLYNAKIKDGALKGVDMSICGDEGCSPIILRRCYFDLFEIVLNGLHVPKDNHCSLILGSSGIGKSWFQVFCLYVFIKANVPVFYQLQDYSALVYKGEVYKCSIPVAKSELLNSSNIWFLYDRDEAPCDISTKNVSIMVSKTKKAIYGKYKKTSSFPPLFMPTWEFKELELKNSFLPAEERLTEDQLHDHTTHCGCIPRNVFTSFYTIIRHYKDELSSVTNEHAEVSQHKGDEGWTETNWEDFEGMPERIFGLQVYENYFHAELCYHNRSMSYDASKLLLSKDALYRYLGSNI